MWCYGTIRDHPGRQWGWKKRPRTEPWVNQHWRLRRGRNWEDATSEVRGKPGWKMSWKLGEQSVSGKKERSPWSDVAERLGKMKPEILRRIGDDGGDCCPWQEDKGHIVYGLFTPMCPVQYSVWSTRETETTSVECWMNESMDLQVFPSLFPSQCNLCLF